MLAVLRAVNPGLPRDIPLHSCCCAPHPLQQLRAASGASSQSDTPSLADATKLQASQTPQAQAAAAMATQQPQQPQQQQQPKAAQVPPQLQLASMLQISRAPSAPLPVSAGAPAPPLLQLLQLQQAQQAQQLQQLPQLQQAQQQQALLQRALAPGGADDMSRAAQQLSQLLQLLQTVNDGGAAPLASLGQSLPFLATSTPLQLSLPGAAPSPMAALGSLLAGLPGLATPASIPQPQLSSANLINMLLSGAGATPSPLPAWPTVPVALPNLAAKAGNPGPAPPSSPGPDDAAAWNHALERAALAWVASQGTLSSYAAPAPVKAEGDAALPKQHSGAPPTPRQGLRMLPHPTWAKGMCCTGILPVRARPSTCPFACPSLQGCAYGCHGSVGQPGCRGR